MSNKLYFLISFVLVLSLAGNVLAYETFVWDHDEGAGVTRLWDDPNNWNSPGKIDRLPLAKDWVEISEYGDPCHGPIINGDMNAVCAWIDIGYYASGAEAILTMEGGSLTIGFWLSMGYYQGGNFRLDITGGTVDVDYVYAGVVATSGSAIINMSGGAFNTPEYQKGMAPWDFGYLAIGTGVLCPQADMNMTDGDANVGWLQIGSWDTRTGKGHVDLHGGTLEADILGMGGGGEGTMDFAYDGTLIIDGDYRVPNGWLFDPCSDTPLDEANWDDDENAYIDPPGAPVDWDGYTGTIIGILAKRGLITAYGTKVGEIINDGNYPSVDGLRAVINLDYDVTNRGQTTITAGAVDPNLAFNPDPHHFGGGDLTTDVNLLSWVAGDNAASHEVYFGTDFNDVNDATTDVNLGVYEGNQPLDVNYHPVDVIWGTTYYWRIDEVNDPNTWKGTVWNFTIIPAWALNPSPTGTGASITSTILSWGPGPLVAAVNGHYVYFSTDANAVRDRDPCVLTIRSPNDLDPGELVFSTPYYWAVDEFNDNEEPNLWPSPVWSFTTTDHLIVENFNSYHTDHQDLRANWRDYYEKQDTGSELFVERSPARDVNSMKFKYKNFSKFKNNYGSETEADIANLQSESGLDWNFGGAKALVLYFYGDPCNSADANDQMYVALEDAGNNIGLVKYAPCHGYDMYDITFPFWHRWSISLKDPNFIAGASPNPVDMNNVTKIYIGFGGERVLGANLQGTNGFVYFEDIQLYPPVCVPGKVAADITGDDCITNYADLDIMARDWLMYDHNVTAVAITGDPCGWWQFDEGKNAIAVDSSAYGNDGTIHEYYWVDGHPNDPNDSALHFDADAVVYDRVICAERDGNDPGTYPAELMPATFTVACWAKIDTFDYFEGLVGNGTDWGDDEGGFYLYSSGHTGNETFGLMIRTEDGLNFVETQNIYKENMWYHLAATYNDANMVSWYVDGELVPCGLARGGNPATFGGPIKPADVGGPIRWINNNDNYPDVFSIGAFWSGGGNVADWYYAQATIDEVRLYGYALPPGEIVTLAEQGSARYHELTSPANIYDLEAKLSQKVNFRDYTILADNWLEDPLIWPW